MKPMRFIVITHGSNGERRQVWNPKMPLRLSYPSKEILTVEKNEIIATTGGRERRVVSPFPPTPGQNLVETTDFRVEIKLVDELSVLSVDSSDERGNGVAVFSFENGGRLASFEPMKKSFVGKFHKQPVFRLTKSGERFEVQPLIEGITLSTEKRTLSAAELKSLSIQYSDRSWRFDDVKHVEIDERSARDEEAPVMRRSAVAATILGGVVTALLLIQSPKQAAFSEKAVPSIAQVSIENTPNIVPSSVATAPETTSETPKLPAGAIGLAAGGTTVTAQKGAGSDSSSPRVKGPAGSGANLAPHAVASSAPAKSAEISRLKAMMGGIANSIAVVDEPKAAVNAKETAPTNKNTADSKQLALHEVTPQLASTGLIDQLAGAYNPNRGQVTSMAARIASAEGKAGTGNGKAGTGAGSSGSFARGITANERVAGQGQSYVTLEEESGTVAGELSRDEVDSIIQSRIPEVRRCYEAAMRDHVSFQGRLLVEFRIHSDGSTGTVKLKTSDSVNETLSQCLTSNIAQWKFPKPRTGADVEVSYPFVFMSIGEES